MRSITYLFSRRLSNCGSEGPKYLRSSKGDKVLFKGKPHSASKMIGPLEYLNTWNNKNSILITCRRDIEVSQRWCFWRMAALTPNTCRWSEACIMYTIQTTSDTSGGLRHTKGSLIAWVVVIPKEEQARVAAPILLLVWHRLFSIFLSFFVLIFFLLYFIKVIPKEGQWLRILGTSLRAATHIHYTNYFKYSEKQILVLDGEMFMRDPYIVCKQVEKFLQLQPYIQMDHFVYSEKKKFFCKRVHGETICMNKKKGRHHKKVREEDLKILYEFYKPHNMVLENMLNYNFSWPRWFCINWLWQF